MQSDRPQISVPFDSVETPALLLDIGIAEHNLKSYVRVPCRQASASSPSCQII